MSNARLHVERVGSNTNNKNVRLSSAVSRSMRVIAAMSDSLRTQENNNEKSKNITEGRADAASAGARNHRRTAAC